MKRLLGVIVLCVAIGFLFANRSGRELISIDEEAFFVEKEIDLDALSLSETALVEQGESAIVSARDKTNQVKTSFSGAGIVVGVYNNALDTAGLSYINDAQSREDFTDFLREMRRFGAKSELKVEIWYQWDSTEKISFFYRYLLSRGISPENVRITQIDKDAFGAQIIADARSGTFRAFNLD